MLLNEHGVNVFCERIADFSGASESGDSLKITGSDEPLFEKILSMPLHVPISSDSHKNVFSHLNQLSREEFEIHERATRAAQLFKRSEAALLEALIQVGQAKVYIRLGYPSLFRYATESLGLSEAVAYAAISVARKASVIPELRAAVGKGELGFSKAKKILSVLNPAASSSEQKAWVDRAILFSSRKIERAVAAENPREAISERVVYKSARRAEVTLGVEEDLLLDLRQVQNLVSSARGKSVSLEGVLREMVGFYLERRDPERRAKRVVAKKGLLQGQRVPVLNRKERFTGTVSKRTPLPASLIHQIRLRDGNQCQARMPGGKACGSRRWLDLHHRVPVHQGGANSLANITTLCRAHHQAHHARERTLGNLLIRANHPSDPSSLAD
jgi:hypothetical protein